MIYIVSPGRCGSAWLATLLVASGLKGQHEWTPSSVHFDAQFGADTSWIWNIDSFIASLKPEDSIIVLDRPQKERDTSANKILGTTKQWDDIEAQWNAAKEKIKELYNDVLWLKFEDMFQYSGRSALWHWLNLNISQERFHLIHDFLKHMNIQNQTAINEVKESYGKK